MASIFYLESHRRWVVAWTGSDGRRMQRRFPDVESAQAFTPVDERPGRRDMRPAEIRFTERHEVDGNGCWVWNHHRTADGYAQMSVRGVATLMHRWSYERAMGGRIPDGMQIDHLCRNRACVNPAHMEVVTARENVMRSPVAEAALNAAKTHCPQRHPYSPENTYLYGPHRRWRQCKACARDAAARRYAGRKSAEVAS